MEQSQVHAIAERAKQVSEALDERQRQNVVEYVTEFVKTGETYGYHIPFNKEDRIDAYAALFGLAELTNNKVLVTYHCNKRGSEPTVQNEPFVFGEGWTVSRALSNLADQHGSDDYPNDFYAGFALQLDDSSCIVFGVEQDEFPGICGDCYSDGYDSAFHGCGHAEDTYKTQHWFMVCDITDVTNIDWERGDMR